MPRKSSHARGYNKNHKALRASIQPTIDAGLGMCCELICKHPTRHIPAGAKWDLAHDRDNPGHYLGPSHQACNRAEGARFGNRLRGTPRKAWTL